MQIIAKMKKWRNIDKSAKKWYNLENSVHRVLILVGGKNESQIF